MSIPPTPSNTFNDCPGTPPGSGVPTCKQCIEFLMHYIDGELPERERASFDAHMAACPPCKEYLRTYVASIKLCREQKPACVPAIPEEMVRAILAARKSEFDGV